MQCSKCGTVLEEGMIFCPKCGTMAEVDLTLHRTPAPEPEEIFEEPVAEEPVAVEVPVEEPPKERMKIPRGFLLALGLTVAVLLIAAIVVVAISQQPESYTTAVENYIAIAYEGDFSKLDLLAPEEYWDHMTTNGPYGTGSLDVLKKENELWYIKRRAIMQISSGEDMQVTYKITAEKSVEANHLESVRGALEQQYRIEPDSVKEGYILDIDLYFSGSKGSQTESMTGVYALLIDDRWYLATGANYWTGYVQFYLTGYGWIE